MKVIQVKFASWDKVYNFSYTDQVLIVGDQVVVKTELGTDLGSVTSFKEIDQGGLTEEELSRQILRKAMADDLASLPDEKKKRSDLEFCKKMIDKYNLPMKLVDLHYSFDNSRLTFAFIADGRIDFREPVKDLTRHFNRNIRLQQIGIRDEAKFAGGYGRCGRPLCCGQFLGQLASITSEMAEVQQCAHRGSERISGICGRLLCCLAFEAEGYRKLQENLPPLESQVTIEGKRGRVVAHHVLKQTVDVELVGTNGEAGTIIEVEASKIKK